MVSIGVGDGLVSRKSMNGLITEYPQCIGDRDDFNAKHGKIARSSPQ